MSTIYLHVGPHKTGTTYLQKLWEKNPDSLSLNGLVYPNVFYVAKGQHHLVTHLLSNDLGEAFQKGIDYLNSINKDIILSSENFSVLKKEQFDVIRQVFSDKEIKVVYYYRNPTQRFLSKWQETVKHGGRESFFEYYTKHNLKPFMSNELNPLLLLNLLSQVFGKENISIIDYQNAYSNLSMMKEFEKVMQRENVIPDIDESVNSMRNLADIEIIRVLNHKAFDKNILNQSNIREIYYKLLRKNILNVEELKEIFFTYSSSLILGNTQVDRQVYLELERHYSTNFVNKISKANDKKYQLINDRFMLDKNIMLEIDHVFNLILEYIDK